MKRELLIEFVEWLQDKEYLPASPVVDDFITENEHHKEKGTVVWRVQHECSEDSIKVEFKKQYDV